MVYGPIAAYLVEAFPARIRYTALSLPYHIGNGIFRRIATGDRIVGSGSDRKHLCRTLLSDCSGGYHVHCGLAAVERNEAHA